jgi:hypothetical protein
VSVATEPSRHTVRAHFYCAVGARAVATRAPDASEEIEVVTVPKSALVDLVLRGDIAHGVHVGAILVADRRGLLAAC